MNRDTKRLTVAIVPTGAANLASVRAGLERAGLKSELVRTPDDILAAPGVVLPGVGAFGPAMDLLRARRLDEPLRRRIAGGRPTLAICLGMQLLFESSRESPGTLGLCALPGTADRFPGGVCVPHFGWNQVAVEGEGLLQPGSAYFANSYRVSEIPEGWRGAVTDYAGIFVSALEKGDLLACQFHPELSGGWGRDLLARWGERVRTANEKEMSC